MVRLVIAMTRRFNSKKRITLREGFEISKNSLQMMDMSMENLKKGISGEPIDFSKYDFIENLSYEEDEKITAKQ